MNKQERKALASFMGLVLLQMHPNYNEYPFEQIEGVLEKYGDESDEFQKLPSYSVHAYFMKRAIKVICGEIVNC